MADFRSLLDLQARSRRNALRATRRLRRERIEAAEARTALAAAGPEPSFTDAKPVGDFR